MQLVVDSNVYIFALGLTRVAACEDLILTIINKPDLHSLRISRNILSEIRSHLAPEDFQELMGIISSLTKIDEDFLVPFELGAKYEVIGLKSSDALIAAYTEWTGADVLVTENRHFLSRKSNLPFKVISAEACLKLLNK